MHTILNDVEKVGKKAPLGGVCSAPSMSRLNPIICDMSRIINYEREGTVHVAVIKVRQWLGNLLLLPSF